MKLQSIEYSNSDKWYTPEQLPTNPREILIHTKEFGTTSGCYQFEKWFLFRWQCFINNPIYWRESPRYEGQTSI